MVYVPNTPWVDGSGGGTPLSAARLNNMEAGISPTWISYTPTWTSSGTPPAIGTSTVVGYYVQVGKIVHAYGAITFSGATFGTGNYSFSLPVTASAHHTSTSANVIGQVHLEDTGSSLMASATAQVISSTTWRALFGATYLGVITAVGQTAPWTWANTDSIYWNITYEAA